MLGNLSPQIIVLKENANAQETHLLCIFLPSFIFELFTEGRCSVLSLSRLMLENTTRTTLALLAHILLLHRKNVNLPI